MPTRPLTRAQLHENRCFLEALSHTGNVRLAVRELGLNRSTFTKRRANHPAFAQEWDAALAAAHARFHLSGGTRPPQSAPPARLQGMPPKTRGGEPAIIRRSNGKLQLRRAQAGQISMAAEQSFLAALSATANIRLSAAAAGFAHTSFYHRKAKNKGFALEMRAALDMGYDRLEMAMLESFSPYAHCHDEWRQHEPPPIPPMTATEALQLLSLHHVSVRNDFDLKHRGRRRAETRQQYGKRLSIMFWADQRRLAENNAMERASQFIKDGTWRLPGDWPKAPTLPPLDQVTGWSKAKGRGSGKAKMSDETSQITAPGKGMFGGWTIADWDGVKRRR